MSNPFSPIPEVLEELRQGRCIVLVDDEDRENEGDVVVAAEFVTPEAVNFMATQGRGLICLALTSKRVEELHLPPMAPYNTSRFGTAFCVSIEAAEGVTTGISAADRARTMRVAADPACTADDLVQPGHVFPLRAHDGGVLARTGQTEGSVDLCRLAGLEPAAVICEVMNEDGTMARVPDLERFCQRHGLKMCTIQHIIEHRCRHEQVLRRETMRKVSNAFGEFALLEYVHQMDGSRHYALVFGEVAGKADVLVRIHQESFANDVFGAMLSQPRNNGPERDLPGNALSEAMHQITREGRGVLVYVRADEDDRLPEAGWRSKTTQHMETYREGICAQILRDLDVRSMRLLGQVPARVSGLERQGVVVTGRVPFEAGAEGKTIYT